MGVQIAIDDFGVGYSSLSYLSHFPIDTLKIDQLFIRMLAKDESYKKIVESIVMMAHGLGMGVIAEGVETQEQIDALKILNCEWAQGYCIAAPAGNDALAALLAETLAGENKFSNRLVNSEKAETSE